VLASALMPASPDTVGLRSHKPYLFDSLLPSSTHTCHRRLLAALHVRPFGVATYYGLC